MKKYSLRLVAILGVVHLLCFSVAWGVSANEKREQDFYRSGVQQYLNGNDAAAIADLTEVLRLNEKNEKARKLLAKSLARSKVAVPAVPKLTQELPREPRVEKSVEKPREAAPNYTRPPKIKVPVKKKKRIVEPEPEAEEVEEVEEVEEEEYKPPPKRKKTVRAEENKQILWIGLGGGVFVCLLFVIFLVLHMAKRNREDLLAQMKLLMEDKKKQELDFTERINQKKREEEETRKAEAKERQRRVEQRIAEDMKIQEQRRAQAAQAATIKPPTPPPQPSPAPSSEIVNHYQKQIMELMVDVPAPKKMEAWERISAQILNLYAASKEAAIQFLQTLAKDSNATARAGTISALAEIHSPETLEILFKLRNDPHPEVQREVLKHLKALLQDMSNGITDEYRVKIAGIYQDEKDKGDWII